MENEIKAVRMKRKEGGDLSSVKKFGLEAAKQANAFHRSFPEYQITPLAELTDLAAGLGVAGIYVKDESYRFGLNAFKVLGGSYAIGRYLAERMNLDCSQLTYEKLTDGAVKKELGELTFVTATDGNHGRGVAWTANRLGHKSVVYMPKGSAEERLQNIRVLGADASITDLNYDDAVRLAQEKGRQNGWIVVQDTSWEGYEKIPGWIMEGYTTMAYEAYNQLKGVKPTHIFLQAGVGAMSGAVTGFFTDVYGDRERPVVTIIEPDKADCLFRTARASDGKLHPVKGDMNTIMAGLACGEPNTISWDILRNHVKVFIAAPDWVAVKGMRMLAAPIKGDVPVTSGESGAAPFGALAAIMTMDEYKDLKNAIGLNENSRVLLFSTEGDTDPIRYKNIVWEGKER